MFRAARGSGGRLPSVKAFAGSTSLSAAGDLKHNVDHDAMIGAVPYYFGLFAVVFYAALRAFGSLKISKDDRALLSSCAVSLVHGVPAAVLAASQVYTAFPVVIDSVNKAEHVQLLHFTLAYMLADTALYLVPYTPTDFLFCTHHLVVIVYVVTTILLGRGAISCVIMLFLGECTSLLQNSWYFCKVLRSESQTADILLQRLNLLYPASYLLARSLVGPPAVFWICRGLWKSEKIPAAYKFTWVFICVLSLAGSQLWSFNLVRSLSVANGAKPQQAAEKLADKR